MKKTLLVVVLLCAVTAFSFAQGTHVDVGQSTIGGGISTMTVGGFGVAGSYEYIFYKLSIPDAFPITFGGAAKAGIYLPAWWDHGMAFNVAALATAHLSLSAFSDFPKEVQNFDFYVELGPSICVGQEFGFGPAFGGGFSYYISPKMAINVDNYYNYYFGGWYSRDVATLGITMKL